VNAELDVIPGEPADRTGPEGPSRRRRLPE
jgi:hypothetical protein